MTDRDGLVTTYAYNSLNEMVREQWLDGSSVQRSLNYAYDLAGNLTSTSDPSASYSFLYDDLNRPTSVTTTLPGLDPKVTFLSQYDSSGNRTQLAASLPDINTGDTRVFYYDFRNRLSPKPIQTRNCRDYNKAPPFPASSAR